MEKIVMRHLFWGQRQLSTGGEGTFLQKAGSISIRQADLCVTWWYSETCVKYTHTNVYVHKYYMYIWEAFYVLCMFKLSIRSLHKNERGGSTQCFENT